MGEFPQHAQAEGKGRRVGDIQCEQALRAGAGRAHQHAAPVAAHLRLAGRQGPVDIGAVAVVGRRQCGQGTEQHVRDIGEQFAAGAGIEGMQHAVVGAKVDGRNAPLRAPLEGAVARIGPGMRHRVGARANEDGGAVHGVAQQAGTAPEAPAFERAVAAQEVQPLRAQAVAGFAGVVRQAFQCIALFGRQQLPQEGHGSAVGIEREDMPQRRRAPGQQARRVPPGLQAQLAVGVAHQPGAGQCAAAVGERVGGAEDEGFLGAAGLQARARHRQRRAVDGAPHRPAGQRDLFVRRAHQRRGAGCRRRHGRRLAGCRGRCRKGRAGESGQGQHGASLHDQAAQQAPAQRHDGPPWQEKRASAGGAIHGRLSHPAGAGLPAAPPACRRGCRSRSQSPGTGSPHPRPLPFPAAGTAGARRCSGAA